MRLKVSIFIFFTIFVFVNSDEIENVCDSEVCHEESARIRANMNENIDPCDDFYEFACGTFLKNTEIPDAKKLVDTFSIVSDKLDKQLREILSEPVKNDEIKPFQNAKKLYKACMDVDLIEKRGTTPMLNVLNSMGGWPVTLDNWDENSWTWQKSVQNSRKNGFPLDYFTSVSVSVDLMNSNRRVVGLSSADLELSRKFLMKKMDEPVVEAYHKYQVDLAVMLGAERSRAELEMKEALEFEFKVAEISLEPEDARDFSKLYNPRNISQLQAEFNYNDWLSYFNNIMPQEVQLTESEVVVVYDINFIEKFGDLLTKTSKRTLANYVMWRHAFDAVKFMPQVFKDRTQEYLQVVTGKTAQDPRWLQCVGTVDSYNSRAVGALYVRKYFNQEAKKTALEMVHNIKSEFLEILKENDWMDPETKREAIKKATEMTELIGYVDDFMDDAKIEEYYATFQNATKEDELFESIRRNKIASATKVLKRLREPVARIDWTDLATPAMVNALFHPLLNYIYFPAGILQGAFFNAERPQYMNYGAIGSVIGHEITHGFDDTGSQFDSDGNLRNWWAEGTRAAFKKKAQCLIEQYGNFTEPLTNMSLNGITTQGENIADNGGFKEAYYAYVKWSKNNPEPKLPDLKYTPEQMYWISAAQPWCGVVREETMKNRVTTDTHSPGQFRVIGTLRNLKEFSSDFHCKVGTKMNPEKKCKVW